MAVLRFEQTHYSPEDNIKALLDGLPALAHQSVECEIYGFTDLQLVAALITAAKRGVRVRVNNDRSQSMGPADHLALQTLVDANVGIQVKITESIHGAIDHLKMVIIDSVDGPLADSSSVLMGSYNFSDGAEKQDNFVNWSNDPGRVAQATAKFESDWLHNISKPEWQLTPTVVPPATP